MNAALSRTEIRTSLNERFGNDLTIREESPSEVLPSGIAGIDIPRGTLTEIWGPPSSGRNSSLYGVFARTTRRPEFCALIDASGGFDPLSATNAGIYLPHLLWLRCANAEKALKAADLVVHAGGFGVVAMDLAGVPSRDVRRISLASWFRLRHAVEKTPTALIVISDERHTSSSSTFQIENHSRGFAIADDLLQRLEIHAALGPRNRAKSAFALKPLYRA
jgi:hypothetical protein